MLIECFVSIEAAMLIEMTMEPGYVLAFTVLSVVVRGSVRLRRLCLLGVRASGGCACGAGEAER